MHMYDQMFNDINRHIVVVWQAVGTLIAAVALLSLVEKGIVPLDFAAAIILLVGVWLLAHLQDAAYWYNRNLAIIANIERQFLISGDLRDIHYYFGKHRRGNVMLTHLKIQYYFGLGIITLATLYHFFIRVLPGLGAPWRNFDPVRVLPYLVVVAGVWLLVRLARKLREKYNEFLHESPGTSVDTTEVHYGNGHPSS